MRRVPGAVAVPREYAIGLLARVPVRGIYSGIAPERLRAVAKAAGRPKRPGDPNSHRSWNGTSPPWPSCGASTSEASGEPPSRPERYRAGPQGPLDAARSR